MEYICICNVMQCPVAKVCVATCMSFEMRTHKTSITQWFCALNISITVSFFLYFFFFLFDSLTHSSFVSFQRQTAGLYAAMHDLLLSQPSNTIIMRTNFENDFSHQFVVLHFLANARCSIFCCFFMCFSFTS